jgi:GNAT superfamily N-acetyltransferase
MNTNTRQIQIRPSVDGDNAGIRKVQVTTWKSAYRGMIPDRILDQMSIDNPPRRSKTPDTLITNSRRAFVALDDAKEILGFAVGGLPRSTDWNYESELWAIYVLPSEQGRGIGKKLFNALASELSKDYKNLIIWVLEANLSSHKFYESMGGKRLPLQKPFKWEDESIATEVAYGWDSTV